MMRCPHCHVSLTRDPDRWRCRLCAYSVPILWPRTAVALLALALVVSACGEIGDIAKRAAGWCLDGITSGWQRQRAQDGVRGTSGGEATDAAPTGDASE